jgi:hypothetical protein
VVSARASWRSSRSQAIAGSTGSLAPLEAFAIRLREGPDKTTESTPHRFCSAETYRTGYLFEAFITRFQPSASCLDAQLPNKTSRRYSYLTRKYAGEVSGAHCDSIS